MDEEAIMENYYADKYDEPRTDRNAWSTGYICPTCDYGMKPEWNGVCPDCGRKG